MLLVKELLGKVRKITNFVLSTREVINDHVLSLGRVVTIAN